MTIEDCLLSLTPSDPTATLFFFCFLSLKLWDLEVLVLKGGRLSLGDTELVLSLLLGQCDL